MAKKIIKEEIPVDKDPKYSLEDKQFLSTIFRVAAPTQMQLDHILFLYKKYVNPTQPPYRSCGACDGTFMKIFGGLRDFWSQNSSKFPN